MKFLVVIDGSWFNSLLLLCLSDFINQAVDVNFNVIESCAQISAVGLINNKPINLYSSSIVPTNKS